MKTLRTRNTLSINHRSKRASLLDSVLRLSPNADTRNAGHGRVADYVAGLPSEFVEDAPLLAGSERSLKFVSSDSNYATLGSRLTTGSLTSLSACCWVKPTSDTSAMVIMGQWDYTINQRSWLIHRNAASSEVRVYVSPDGTTFYWRQVASGALPDVWTHIGFVFEESDITIYVNGVAASTTAADTPVASINDGSDFIIGSYASSAMFDGNLRDACVYSSVALTADEMLHLATGGASGTAPTATPVGQWDMDGSDAGTSTVTDSSGNGNHLTLTNFGTRIEDQTVDADDAAYVVDVPDVFKSSLQTYSLEFDGTDDYVEVPYSEALGFTGAYTISFWVKLDAVKNYNPVFIRGEGDTNDIEVFYDSTFMAIVHNRGNGGTYARINSNYARVADSWQHYAVTYNGSDSWRVYLNGVSVATGASAGEGAPPLDTTRPCRIGWAEHSVFGANDHLDGRLADFQIFDSELSAENVASIVAGGSPTAPIVEWDFDGDTWDGAGPNNGIRNGYTSSELILSGNYLWHYESATSRSIWFDGMDGIGVCYDPPKPGTDDFSLSFHIRPDFDFPITGVVAIRNRALGGWGTAEGWFVTLARTSGTDNIELNNVGIEDAAGNNTQTNATGKPTICQRDEWCHLILSFDRDANLRVWADGDLVMTHDISSVSGTVDEDYLSVAGPWDAPGTLAAPCRMGEVVWYDKALNESEVATIFDQGRSILGRSLPESQAVLILPTPASFTPVPGETVYVEQNLSPSSEDIDEFNSLSATAEASGAQFTTALNASGTDPMFRIAPDEDESALGPIINSDYPSWVICRRPEGAADRDVDSANSAAHSELHYASDDGTIAIDPANQAGFYPDFGVRHFIRFTFHIPPEFEQWKREFLDLADDPEDYQFLVYQVHSQVDSGESIIGSFHRLEIKFDNGSTPYIAYRFGGDNRIITSDPWTNPLTTYHASNAISAVGGNSYDVLMELEYGLESADRPITGGDGDETQPTNDPYTSVQVGPMGGSLTEFIDVADQGLTNVLPALPFGSSTQFRGPRTPRNCVYSGIPTNLILPRKNYPTSERRIYFSNIKLWTEP